MNGQGLDLETRSAGTVQAEAADGKPRLLYKACACAGRLRAAPARFAGLPAADGAGKPFFGSPVTAGPMRR